MPLYEYQCQQCGTIIEKFFSMSKKPQEFVDECSHCKETTTLKSVISVIAMSYNGFNHAAKVPSDLKNRFDQIRKHYPNMQSTV